MASTGAFDGGLTDDAFLGGRLKILQPRTGFRSGHDALLLAASVPARPGDAALDLGTGAGAAILALAARVPGLSLAGLERDPRYAALARENAARNGFALEVIEADVADPPPMGAFDHVLANPPYFDRSRSTRAKSAREAGQGADVPLAAWLALAARRLRPGGTLALIQRAERLPELLAGLPRSMGSVEILPLAPEAGREGATLILRARKGGRAPFRLLPPLELREGGADAPAIRAALRDSAPLPWAIKASERPLGETLPPRGPA